MKIILRNDEAVFIFRIVILVDYWLVSFKIENTPRLRKIYSLYLFDRLIFKRMVKQ